MAATTVTLLVVGTMFTASAIWAATPQQIVISGGGLGSSVSIKQPSDVDVVMRDLCAGPGADIDDANLHYDVAIHWSEGLVWRGKLFLDNGTDPPTADVPEWKLFTSDSSSEQTCYRRKIGSGALARIEQYGVPMSTDELQHPSEQSSDTDESALLRKVPQPDRGGYRGFYLPLSASAAIGLVLGVFLLLRKLRRARGTE